MAVSKDIAAREAAYAERNQGWSPIHTLAPGVLVLTKIDDPIEGARNIDTPMALRSRDVRYPNPGQRLTFVNGAGELIHYTPTHWRDMPAGWPVRREPLEGVAYKSQGMTFGEAMKLEPFQAGPDFIPGMVLRLAEPIDMDSLRDVFSRPRGPIMPLVEGPTFTGRVINPEPIAVFGSTDGSPLNFEVKLCNNRSLWATVYELMYPGGAASPGYMSDSQTEEVTAIVESLRETGKMDFEDGGLQMYRGVEAIVNELVGRATDIARDRDHDNSERCKAVAACEAARLEYAVLCGSLRDALGAPGMEAMNAALSMPRGMG